MLKKYFSKSQNSSVTKNKHNNNYFLNLQNLISHLFSGLVSYWLNNGQIDLGWAPLTKGERRIILTIKFIASFSHITLDQHNIIQYTGWSTVGQYGAYKEEVCGRSSLVQAGQTKGQTTEQVFYRKNSRPMSTVLQCTKSEPQEKKPLRKRKDNLSIIVINL